MLLKPPTKPQFPLAEPLRLPKGKTVTIAAGFCCDDGVLLCADSQESYGEFKRHQAKIAIRPNNWFRQQGGLIKALFAGAGDGTFIDIMVEKMWAAIESKGQYQLGPVIAALEDQAIRVHQKYWPVYPEKDRPNAHLLIALYIKGEKPKLLRVEGPLLVEVQEYDCIGYGVPLAKYLCDRIWECPMSLRPSILAALYMLEQVKEHVEYCGGRSNFAYLQNDGTLRGGLSPHTGIVQELSKFFDYFDESMARLLTTAPNLGVSDEEFDNRLKHFSEHMLMLRNEFHSVKVLNRLLNELETRWEKGDCPF